MKRLGLTVFILIFALGTSFRAHAGPFFYDHYYDQNTDLIDRTTHELDMDLLSKIYLLSEEYKFSLTNYIPTRNLPQNDSGDVIARRVLKHTLQNFLDNYKEVPGSGVNTVVRTNNNMKTTVGSSKHALLFRLRPIEALAEVKYKGSLPIQARFSYEIDREESRLEFSKEYSGKTYAYTRIVDKDQSVDLFSVRWGF